MKTILLPIGFASVYAEDGSPKAKAVVAIGEKCKNAEKNQYCSNKNSHCIWWPTTKENWEIVHRVAEQAAAGQTLIEASSDPKTYLSCVQHLNQETETNSTTTAQSCTHHAKVEGCVENCDNVMVKTDCGKNGALCREFCAACPESFCQESAKKKSAKKVRNQLDTDRASPVARQCSVKTQCGTSHAAWFINTNDKAYAAPWFGMMQCSNDDSCACPASSAGINTAHRCAQGVVQFSQGAESGCEKVNADTKCTPATTEKLASTAPLAAAPAAGADATTKLSETTAADAIKKPTETTVAASTAAGTGKKNKGKKFLQENPADEKEQEKRDLAAEPVVEVNKFMIGDQISHSKRGQGTVVQAKTDGSVEVIYENATEKVYVYTKENSDKLTKQEKKLDKDAAAAALDDANKNVAPATVTEAPALSSNDSKHGHDDDFSAKSGLAMSVAVIAGLFIL